MNTTHVLGNVVVGRKPIENEGLNFGSVNDSILIGDGAILAVNDKPSHKSILIGSNSELSGPGNICIGRDQTVYGENNIVLSNTKETIHGDNRVCINGCFIIEEIQALKNTIKELRDEVDCLNTCVYTKTDKLS